MKRKGVLLLLMTIALLGCAAAFEQAKMDHFNKYADRYRLSLLRGDFRQAASMISPADRKPLDSEKMKEIKIVDYNLVGVIASGEHDEIRQEVELQYFLKSRNILKSVQYQQLWEYQNEGRVWLLKTDLPEFEELNGK